MTLKVNYINRLKTLFYLDLERNVRNATNLQRFIEDVV